MGTSISIDQLRAEVVVRSRSARFIPNVAKQIGASEQAVFHFAVNGAGLPRDVLQKLATILFGEGAVYDAASERGKTS